MVVVSRTLSSAVRRSVRLKCRHGRALSVVVIALSVLSLAILSCVDTERVLVEGPLFDDPPTAAQGFLGYSNVRDGRPVCGNCHVGQNAEWQETAHSHAWNDLQESGYAAESCEGCHTVGANGNLVVAQNVGWTATADPRYWDVQCESCHGPGLEHVTNPDATQPLASIKVGVELESGCGECHQSLHYPFVEEWSQSRHANEQNHAREVEACQGCHEGKGALRAFGVKAEYLEKDSEELISITCAVCHDPHDATNEGQLRFPIDVPDVNENLCMKCHQRRAVPDPTSSRGPHSPQGPLLLGGDVGWRPPNFEYDEGSIVGTHGTERNPRLCATCHVHPTRVRDGTNSFELDATGHLFKPIPCLDAQGVPTAEDDCELAERSFASCQASGCHNESGARSAYILATTRVADLVEELEALLDQVPESEFDTSDNVYTTAEGSLFNARLGDIRSSAIHNPFLTEALLTASIRQVEEDYGVALPVGVSLENILGGGGD
jgi:predicted CXXCH cytochrome family protein